MNRLGTALRLGAAFTAAAITAAAFAGRLDESLEGILAETPDDEIVSTLVFLSRQVDLAALNDDFRAERATVARRHEEVVRSLRDLAAVTQGPLLDHLAQLQAQGRIDRFDAHWISNVVRVDTTKDEILRLAAREDVGLVYYNYEIELVAPVNERPQLLQGPGAGGAGDNPEPGLIAIRAPEVWDMGITGQGALVCGIDTGVDGNHQALFDRWRGHDPRYAGNPEWAFHDELTGQQFPFDSGSHGTHTMGTIIGGAPGDEIGVAPGAEWIASAAIDRAGIARTVQDTLAAFEWILDPDGDPQTSWDVPDVASNSWGLVTAHGYPPCDETYWNHLDACETAGIVVVFAAGNEGFSGLRRPGDRATDDYRTFAVAAVDGNTTGYPIAGFSSRGPTFCTPGGQAAIKPEISAPGVSVRSSVPNNGYANLSGTSMATPHIAGVVALMRSANPDIPVEDIKQVIYDTAVDLGAPGNDNDYGHGIVDAFEAVNEALNRAFIRFEYPSGRPDTISPAGGTTLRVEIIPINANPIPGTGQLHYSIDGGSEFFALPMEEVSQNVYDGVFPAVPCRIDVKYYVSVETDQGTFNNPFAAPDFTYEAPAYESVIQVFADDFETNMGWAIQNQNVQAGPWERGNPDGLVRAPFDDFDGSGQCMVTGLDRLVDLDGGPTRLTSPTIDMSLHEYRVSYARWAGGFASPNDNLTVEISNDDGQSWTVVETTNMSNSPQWTPIEFDVTDVIVPTATMKVRFSATDVAPDSTVEAGVDAFIVTEINCGEPTGSVLPHTLDIVFGKYQSGSIVDTYESDDSYLRVQQLPAFTPLLPLIRVELGGSSGQDTASELTYTLEAAATAMPPNVPQRIELRNYDGGTWELVDDRIATLGDQVVQVTIDTNAVRFLEPGTGDVAARLSWFDPGDVISPAWGVRIDQAVWDVVP